MSNNAQNHEATWARQEHGVHILLVDDDEVVAEQIRKTLARSGLRVRLTTARDGAEALRLLRSEELPRHRRLILLDVHMPRMNGLELLKEIREDPKLAPTPVVMISGEADPALIGEAYRYNAAGFLRKPMGIAQEHLMTVLRYWTFAEMP